MAPEGVQSWPFQRTRCILEQTPDKDARNDTCVRMLFFAALLAAKLGEPTMHIRFAPLSLPHLAARKFSLQDGEFDIAWHSVWNRYFEEDSEHEDFMRYFYKNACTHPLKIAVEEVPYRLLVCAKRCKKGTVPILKHLKNGTRVRKCKRVY